MFRIPSRIQGILVLGLGKDLKKKSQNYDTDNGLVFFFSFFLHVGITLNVILLNRQMISLSPLLMKEGNTAFFKEIFCCSAVQGPIQTTKESVLAETT